MELVTLNEQFTSTTVLRVRHSEELKVWPVGTPRSTGGGLSPWEQGVSTSCVPLGPPLVIMLTRGTFWPVRSNFRNIFNRNPKMSTFLYKICSLRA